MMTGVFELKNLRVEIIKDGIPIVQDISLSIQPGEVHALIGESGSGKTTIALAALHHYRPGLRHAGGQALFQGRDLGALSATELRKIRGNEICYVAQSAAAAFNPSLRIGRQVTETAREHDQMNSAAAYERAQLLYREMDLPEPDSIGTRFPHEVSGGQLQRLMAAMAMVSGPKLIVFDEPTTALDVTTQLSVLMSFKKLIKSQGAAAIYVSHDLAVVAQIADSVTVLRNGQIMEQAAMQTLLDAPQHPYSRDLLKAGLPQLSAGAVDLSAVSKPVLSLRGVTAGYGGRKADGMPVTPILHDINLDLPEKTVLGIIGESGSGKSTLAKVVSGLLPQARGEVALDGKTLPPRLENRPLDLAREVQLIFQHADTALNPHQTIRQILERPVQRFFGLSKSERAERVVELMEDVSLPVDMLDRKPGALSGGQKQRINLARALAASPKVLLCDEVTSALDSVVRDSIIDLIRDLRDRKGLSILFITHDISTVSRLADHLVVMNQGRVVEQGPTSEILQNPAEAYTRLLLNSVPKAEQGWLDQAYAFAENQRQAAP